MTAYCLWQDTQGEPFARVAGAAERRAQFNMSRTLA